MKFRNIRNLGLLLLGAATVTSCSDDNATNSEPEYQGELVSFGILDEDAETAPQGIGLKTVYGGKNGNTWAIKWVNGDSVRINKHTGDVQSSMYTVTKTSDETRGTLTLGAKQKGLTWTENLTGNEYFTVVYPSYATEKPAANDKSVTVSYGKGETLLMKGDASGNFTSEINMENLRMLGQVDTKKTRNAVDFTLSPVSSTFEVVVKGPSSGDSYLTGITIYVDNADGYIDSNYKVKYLYNNAENRFVAQKSNDSKALKEVPFIYNINDPNGYITLSSGRTATFTAFVPGILQASGKCRVQLNFAGFSKTMKVNKVILANSRTKLTTPVFTPGGNNVPWITPLDDDVLISSMSIPGTKFAASWKDNIGDNERKIQDLSIEQQWAYGIRAFQFPHYRRSGLFITTEMWPEFRSGGAWWRTGETTEALLNRLVNLLNKDNGEFAIVITNQAEGGADAHHKEVDNLLNKFKNAGKAADFKPNMKIKDARGKILFIHDDGTTTSVGAKMYKWPALNGCNGIISTNMTGAGGTANLSLYVADDHIESSGDVSFRMVRDIAESNIKKTGKTENDELWKITDISTHTAGTRARRYYEAGMDEMNRPLHSVIYNYPGQVGIILCQLVGLHYTTINAERHEIYGDIIVPTLINKNYRYPLKK